MATLEARKRRKNSVADEDRAIKDDILNEITRQALIGDEINDTAMKKIAEEARKRRKNSVLSSSEDDA